MDNRKFLIVLLGTLLTIPLLYLSPGFGDSMANRNGLIMGIIPLAILLGFAASCKPSSWMTFLSGVLTIILGVGFYLLMDAFGTVANSQQGQQAKSFWTLGQHTWMYFFPILCLGLGINLMSAYITHSSA